MTREQNPDSLALSVLVPVRNEGINIKIMLKVLNGVIEVPHEILFVYDHPKDNSIEVANKLKNQFPNTRLIHNQFGAGVVNALKEGVNAAKGQYILVFAADEAANAEKGLAAKAANELDFARQIDPVAEINA